MSRDSRQWCIVSYYNLNDSYHIQSIAEDETDNGNLPNCAGGVTVTIFKVYWRRDSGNGDLLNGEVKLENNL